MGVETVSCRHCHAVYIASVRANGVCAGSQICEVCGGVAIAWEGERSYSDFHLVHRPSEGLRYQVPPNVVPEKK